MPAPLLQRSTPAHSLGALRPRRSARAGGGGPGRGGGGGPDPLPPPAGGGARPGGAPAPPPPPPPPAPAPSAGERERMLTRAWASARLMRARPPGFDWSVRTSWVVLGIVRLLTVPPQ